MNTPQYFWKHVCCRDQWGCCILHLEVFQVRNVNQICTKLLLVPSPAAFIFPMRSWSSIGTNSKTNVNGILYRRRLQTKINKQTHVRKLWQPLIPTSRTGISSTQELFRLHAASCLSSLSWKLCSTLAAAVSATGESFTPRIDRIWFVESPLPECNKYPNFSTDCCAPCSHIQFIIL